MGAYSEELRQSRIEVTSPDGTVTLRVSADGDIQVALADRALARHTEASLERQVSITVRLAIAARAQAYDRALSKVAADDHSGTW
ncbi:hypothetical protein [Krasilnikovia sp. MM14-A1259]|uniref:hypothetical protein n=1 Tax=Krasilnikovia sp. MM14-A1259 TaxID=3373539 RepID=UPI00399D4F66